ncbi:hypothetical protein QEH59_18660, partial [Coraliomargarita sp. SDUM461004]
IGADTLSIAINQADESGQVIDFSAAATDLTVATGPNEADAVIFDMDGADGALITASGNLTVAVYEFFQVSGGFALSKSEGTITLSDADATEVSVDQLTLGGSNVSAFAGLAGGTTDALGFALDELDFALGLFSDQSDATRSWTTLQATASRFEFVGVDGLSVAGSSLSVSINQASDDTEIADFSANPLAVQIGPSSSHDLDLDGSRGALLEVSGDVDIDVYGFVALTGGFAFVKSEATVPVYLNEATGDVAVELLTIGASDVSA